MNQIKCLSLVAFRVFVVGMLALAVGFAANPTAKDTVDSMGAFGNEIAKGKDSIDATTMALEKLTASDAADIKTNNDLYSKAVMALEGQAKSVKATADQMKAMGDSFFKTWEGSESITPERRAELSRGYAKIKDDMVIAADSFKPFLASLKDVQSYVGMDPTVKGINSMGTLVQTAKNNSVDVKAKLDTVLKDLNSVRGMLSTKSS